MSTLSFEAIDVFDVPKSDPEPVEVFSSCMPTSVAYVLHPIADIELS